MDYSFEVLLSKLQWLFSYDSLSFEDFEYFFFNTRLSKYQVKLKITLNFGVYIFQEQSHPYP